MTFETPLIVLAILAFVFVNVVQPWLRKRHAGEQPGEAESDMPVQGQMHVQAPVATTTTPTPSQAPAAVLTAQRETPSRARVPLANGMPPAPSRQRRRSALGSLADARRGIVLRTILGPCRAQQPFDSPSN